MKVYPFLVGELTAHEGDLFRGGNVAMKVPFSCYSFYIEGTKKRTIVETGFGDPQWCMDHLGAGEGFLLTQKPGMALCDHLKRLHVAPESIETVILTHCHWDHIGGVNLFPNARVYCQKDEIPWAFASPEWMQRSYPMAFAEPILSARERLVLVEGDVVLEKGLKMRKIGGHTPGSQIIEVETQKGKVIIAGDLLMKYANIEKMVPIGSFHHMEKCAAFLQILQNEMKEDPRIIVCPGHDQRVWDEHSEGI